MKITETKLPGVLIIEPKVFGDSRGFFLETWQLKRYHEYGIKEQFVQDNLSFSQKGVLRGLHFQNPQAQGKLVYALQGEVFDVAVDICEGSNTFGKWTGVYLSSENKKQFYVPEGFAHGFCVVSETALFAYKCTALYSPENEMSIKWNDPDINIDWPIQEVSLSEKDQLAVFLKDVKQEKLPKYNVD